MINTDENDDKSQPASQRKPQTARCGSTANNHINKYLIYGANPSLIGKSNNMKGFQVLLDILHDKIRSLTERMHEVITTKLKPQREKSYQALSSMKSHLHDKRSKTGRHVGSESRYRSMRGSSKSRRMMRFKRYKS